MPSLVEIAESEQIVLFDTSASPIDNFTEDIFEADRYDQLDRFLLKKARDSMLELLQFVSAKNTFTVREALKDFDNLNYIVSSKATYINFLERPGWRGQKGHDSKKQQFEELSDTIFRILRTAKSKVFEAPDNDLYELFYNAISAYEVQSHETKTKAHSSDIKTKYRQLLAAAFCLAASDLRVAFVVQGISFKNLLFYSSGFTLSFNQREIKRDDLLRNINLYGYKDENGKFYQRHEHEDERATEKAYT